jgi:Xaa-Pro aminopeptidase
MKSEPVSAALFVTNRSRLAKHMSAGSLALVKSGERQLRNGDQYYPFRQDSNFFYLTGIDQEESFFSFCPDHPDPNLREILFIKRSNQKSDLWSGPSLGKEEAKRCSGIGHIRWLEEKDNILQALIHEAELVYADHETGMAQFHPRTHLAPLLQRLRMIKQAEEIEEIKKAISITASAFRRVLNKLEPGLREYQVEAELIGEFIGRGAEGHAFEPIMASGENALILHYTENKALCRDGDLLLMDFGAEFNHYAADCSRTIPVNGRFSSRQRELYNAVLSVFRQARALMVPGIRMADFHEAVGKLWEEQHLALGLYSRKDVKEHEGREALWKKYYMHGTSHAMGLDVHDPFDRSIPFEPGMVLTCEPAIYIPEEGIGIRLENDILITEKGPLDLMASIPMEVDEIEELMNASH